MKKIQYCLSTLFIIGILFSSCENDPKSEVFESDRVAFTYAVEGDEYKEDFFYGSTISFTNTSAVQGDCLWSFGDGTTSTEVNPKHVFETPNTYTVTLTIGGNEKRSGKILISDIVPLVSYTSSDSIPESQKSEILLSVIVPNPKEEQVSHTWIFPDGTIDESGNIIVKSEELNPGKLRFNNIGSQQIRLKTTLGGKDLEDRLINVNIGANKEYKTLYYAVKGGNLMALKLIDDLAPGVKNLPFDLGIKSGQHPFNLLYNEADSSVLVLDAGRQFYYVNDEAGVLGDGRILVVSKDGKKVDVMFNNNGGKAFDDPFSGTIENGSLYFTDRNTGIGVLALDSRNAGGPRKFWVENTYLGYYSKGITFGAINSTIKRYQDMWWWGKSHGAFGIFRFKETDIYSDGSGASKDKPESGVVLNDERVKSFEFHAGGNAFYAAIVNKGIYTCPISAISAGMKLESMTQIANLSSDTEGTADERIYISQMVIEPDNGNLYFAYRSPDETVVKTGIKYYDPSTKTIVPLLEGVAAYGVTVTKHKSKLF